MGIMGNPIKGIIFNFQSGQSLCKMSHLAKSYIKFLQQARNPALISNRTMSAGHNPDGWKMWKKIFFFVACPIIILGNINAFVLADASETEPPPFVPYDHLRIRTKRFPRGDGNHSLIHNPHTNALPGGSSKEH